MSHNLSLGRRGEEFACRYLEKNGYRIREQQWRSRAGEIDIIAERDGTTVFIEVKTRANDAFGYPEEAVTTAKRRHLIRAAELYRQARRLTAPTRIDVLAITLRGEGAPDVVHIEDAVWS